MKLQTACFSKVISSYCLKSSRIGLYYCETIMSFMDLRYTLFLIVSFILLQSCSTSKLKSSNSTAMFQSNAEDWFENGDVKWTIDNQVLTASDGLGYAVTKRSYSNFILETEFMPDSKMNSGIFIRCPEVEFTATGCYEINIADDHPNQEFRTGSIVTHGKPLKHVNSANKWNTYRISAIDNHIEVWLNGIKTADLIDDKSSTGYIGLQVNGEGSIKFRNIRITEK